MVDNIYIFFFEKAITPISLTLIPSLYNSCKQIIRQRASFWSSHGQAYCSRGQFYGQREPLRAIVTYKCIYFSPNKVFSAQQVRCFWLGWPF